MTNYEREISEQPEALENLLRIYSAKETPLARLDAVKNARAFKRIVFLGMGSSLFAAHPAVCRLARYGIPAQAVDASEYIYYLGEPVQSAETLHVLVSQSGESPEVKILADKLAGRPFIALANNEGSYMAGKAAAVLPMAAGEEKSTTGKTYTNTIAAGLLFAEWAARRDAAETIEKIAPIPSRMAAFLKDWRRVMEPAADFIGDPLHHLDILGRGPLMASVWQGGLIMRELAWVKCNAMNSGLFRHGLVPGMKDGGAVIVLAPSGPTKPINLRLADDVEKAGGRCLIVTDGETNPKPGRLAIRFPALDEVLAPLLYILPFETLGILKAERRGIEPGEGILKITPVE